MSTNSQTLVSLMVLSALGCLAGCTSQVALGGPPGGPEAGATPGNPADAALGAAEGGSPGDAGAGGAIEAGNVGNEVGEGGLGAATAIATLIQLTPTNLVSDGTSVFWTSSVDTGGPVYSVPVTGGDVTVVVPGTVPGGFLAVDDANVFFPSNSGVLLRAPKDGGGAPVAIDETDAGVPGPVTVLGNTAFWTVSEANGDNLLQSAPLRGGAVSTLATFSNSPTPTSLGVTASVAFISSFESPTVWSFPIQTGGVPLAVPGLTGGCDLMISDQDAVYCRSSPISSSILRIASDGTVTTLGAVLLGGLTGAGLAIDDSSVYWLDSLTVGTVMRAPKTGGAVTLLARDTQPVAIAVDQNAIYWSDQGGNIMRLPK